jgi:tripartite-type tricarboxylate transporter receptor subunit TctC
MNDRCRTSTRAPARFSACLALALAASTIHAQSFPAKPIRILVPTIAGSAPDVRVRQVAPKLNEAMGQPAKCGEGHQGRRHQAAAVI